MTHHVSSGISIQRAMSNHDSRTVIYVYEHIYWRMEPVEYESALRSLGYHMAADIISAMHRAHVRASLLMFHDSWRYGPYDPAIFTLQFGEAPS